MNITVYLGASSGNDPTLETSVRALGRLIGKSGNALVYGGSKNGLMGALAESVLRAGGEVTGVEPQFFIDKGYEYDEITTLIVTRDMTERKTKMIELGDAFIAFPGGTGTLEEISEIMSKVSLKQLAAPCILYNLNGYYDHLKALLAHMIDMGLSTPERQEGIYFAETLDEIRVILQYLRKAAFGGFSFCAALDRPPSLRYAKRNLKLLTVLQPKARFHFRRISWSTQSARWRKSWTSPLPRCAITIRRVCCPLWSARPAASACFRNRTSSGYRSSAA